jgi:hypothetical protein
VSLRIRVSPGPQSAYKRKLSEHAEFCAQTSVCYGFPECLVVGAGGPGRFGCRVRRLCSQFGPGVEVIALTSVATNLTAIGGGVLVFRETIGTDALAIAGRVSAFCLIVAGAALVPAPVRAVGRVGGRATAAQGSEPGRVPDWE